jgi:hypothetical protein
MPRYKAVLAGNVSERWTKKGREQEMATLSTTLTMESEEGWRLHSVQPVPIFGGSRRSRPPWCC